MVLRVRAGSAASRGLGVEEPRRVGCVDGEMVPCLSGPQGAGGDAGVAGEERAGRCCGACPRPLWGYHAPFWRCPIPWKNLRTDQSPQEETGGAQARPRGQGGGEISAHCCPGAGAGQARKPRGRAEQMGGRVWGGGEEVRRPSSRAQPWLGARVFRLIQGVSGSCAGALSVLRRGLVGRGRPGPRAGLDRPHPCPCRA